MRVNLNGLGQDDTGVDLSTLPLGGENSLPVDIPIDLSNLPLSSGANPSSGSFSPTVPITGGLPSAPSIPGLTPAQLSTLGITASGAVPTSPQVQGAAHVASSTVNADNSTNYLLMAGVVIMVIFGITAMARGK